MNNTAHDQFGGSKNSTCECQGERPDCLCQSPTAEVTAPELSKNQKTFVRSAKRAGLEVFEYSGRGMYGKTCPAVLVSRFEKLKTRAITKTDSLGLDLVVYAQN
jgi:hypothetical protein